MKAGNKKIESAGRRKIIEKLKVCFSREIAIEYKACLYAFCITVFYCIYLICQGIFEANVWYLCEFFVLAYLLGYVQVYFLRNFDEAEMLGIWEAVCMLLYSSLYAGLSCLLGWFHGRLWVTGIFFLYMLLVYGCVYLINRLKRNIDTENLNYMLAEYKRNQYGGFASADGAGDRGSADSRLDYAEKGGNHGKGAESEAGDGWAKCH